MKASMAHDLERGNRLELDWLAGKVRALGREYHIPTPASDTVYTVLKLHRMGNAPRLAAQGTPAARPGLPRE
jgi:2-dehydropantoate 2-reductase